jgi:hypothetical protein
MWLFNGVSTYSLPVAPFISYWSVTSSCIDIKCSLREDVSIVYKCFPLRGCCCVERHRGCIGMNFLTHTIHTHTHNCMCTQHYLCAYQHCLCRSLACCCTGIASHTDLTLHLPLHSQLLSVFISLRCMDDKISWLGGWGSQWRPSQHQWGDRNMKDSPWNCVNQSCCSLTQVLCMDCPHDLSCFQDRV